jgi:hypothetical protein
MFVPRTLLVVVATAVTLAAITAGATLAVTAGASSTTTTYYACLKSGALSNVGTVAPTCKSPATVISWNQTGPPGPAGNTVLNGAGAPPTTVGRVGDFYLETSNYTIYGPATRICSPQLCHTIWGKGTELQGQGFAFDTTLAAPVPDFSGASIPVLTQTLASGGDFTVTARVVGFVSADQGGLDPIDENSDWSCALVAANPGGSTVTIDTNQEYGTSPTTELDLQGVVSLAPGGFVGINCGETETGWDWFSQARITSTQVGGFTTVAPG